MRELGYLFLTSPVCNRIPSNLDVRDHTVLECVFLYDVKSYNTNRDLLLHKNILMCYYNKSVDVGKLYIQYIAVKVMNNVSRKSLD